MDIRELKYFLAVAREQNISRAAEYLYITQPSLSRQMQNLEHEIGKKLFIRGRKKITLTETGVLLRKRAEELVSLYEKTENEIITSTVDISGEIYIGAGESYAICVIAEVTKKLQNDYPGIRLSITSGDSNDIMEKLDKGLIDFGVLVEPCDLSNYDFVRLPQKDTWGVLMRKDSPLAEKEYIVPEDLYSVPVILSKHAINKPEFSNWFKRDANTLDVKATYNLIYNASLLVQERLGYVVTLDRLINITGDSELTFRPLKPRLETTLAFAWKRYQVFSKPAELFLKLLEKTIEQYQNNDD